jgi:predicted Fe-Mo cluster-binding NifX family protein
MRVCVTSAGTSADDPVDPRFGRAAHFLLIDTETRDARCLDDVTAVSQGAGVRVAQSVIDAGAEAVVTGQIGPRAFDVLAAAGIEVYLTPPATAAEAVEAYAAGRLERISKPNSRSHAGMRR